MPVPVLTTDVARKPHPYNADSRDTARVPRCTCGMTKSYRSHQPLWWRLLFHGVKWR